MDEATKKRRENQLTSLLKLEIATAVDRTPRPKSYLAPEAGESLKPFGLGGDADLWLPKVYRRQRNPDGTVARDAKVELIQGSPRTTCFRILELLQARLRDAGNSAIRAMWLEQEKPLPTLDPTDPHGRRRLPPTAGERTPLGTVAYRVICQKLPGGKPPNDVPYAPSDLTAAMSHRLEQMYSKHVKRSRGRHAVPSIGETWPIWMRPGAWRFARKDGLNLSVNLDGTWWELGLRVARRARKQSADPYVLSVLGRLTPGEAHRRDGKLATAEPTVSCYVPGTLGIMQSKGKWYALIQYRQPKPPPLQVENAAVVHCGLRNFAVCFDLQDALTRRGGLWIDGIDLLNRKARFRAQRRELQHHLRIAPIGSGRKAQARSLRLDDREHAWVDAWLRLAAARIVEYARRRAARIYVMKLENIRQRTRGRSDLPEYVQPRVHQAPWFKLRTYIEESAARAGLPVSTYDPWYHTQRCPRCGRIDPAAANYARWKFACLCGYEGHLDRVGAENAFLDLGLVQEIVLPPESAYDKAVRDIRAMTHLTKMDGGGERRGGGGRQLKEDRDVRKYIPSRAATRSQDPAKAKRKR